MEILDFKEAIDRANSGNKHLLLGNGFSIACKPDIFQYLRLFEQADFTKFSPTVKKAFDAINTRDFEKVIRVLKETSKLLSVYPSAPPELINQIGQDAECLKELLIDTLAGNHPEFPANIVDEQYEACCEFLSHFDGKIYTLNYDLLLYWAIMKYKSLGHRPQRDDGFRKPEDNPDSDYVVWEPQHSNKQNIFYLHGALHIFDSGTEIQKYTWVNTQIRLIEQIRDALKRDYYPLFVSEGTSQEKIEKIKHSDYLAKGYRSFSNIGGNLFIYGHSLAENDEHFLNLIETQKLDSIYISIFEDPEKASNQDIIQRALRMPENRKRKKPLNVYFFDASSAEVWGK